MRRAARFLLALLLGLALLTAAAHWALQRTLAEWVERDLTLRAQLTVAAARQGLNLAGADHEKLERALSDITRNERNLGAAACSAAGELLAATEGYPSDFSCRAVLDRMGREGRAQATSWAMTPDLPSGRMHLSVTRLGDADGLGGGFVILLQDLSFLARREETIRNLLLTAFFVLSVAASLVTLLVARIAWKGWTLELRRALRGNATKDFQALVRDVRSLAERLAGEREREAVGGKWTPQRLRSALSQYLEGERIVLLANREPYIHERGPDGVRVLHPASGLVTALEPVMRACSGVWVAHGGGSADRETVDNKDRIRVPPGEESYLLRRVWLSEEEEKGYYYGFSNEGLWPLCHVAHTRPVFRVEDWEHYVRVNRRFTDAVCDEVDSDDPIVLVQDYHFALAPRMIRERLPRATIISFFHIPWPSAERIGICPWRNELISGLLGSSIVGFQTQQHCNNFVDSVDAFVESRIDREKTAIIQGFRRTLVRSYPTSIEWPVRWLEKTPSCSECRLEVFRELGLPESTLVGLGVDRLDYTKGIEERLLAVDNLLTHHSEFRGKFTFVQLAAPSRAKIDRYRELSDRVEALTNEINAKWSQGAYRPIILLHAHHEPSTVYKYYRACDLCYVSSLDDGMNLVAKEFVASRDDDRATLVLSQFTGAARDLTEALIVNPYDIRQAGDALAAALHMPIAERRERMRSMRRVVSEFNVYRWAGRMVMDAAELRRKERMSGRLTNLTRIPVEGI
jgi:trehalose 6-phosphate synthase